MTSKLTREERIQSLYDLKIGQVLNQSDIESIKMLARIALAAMGSEPVFNLLVSQAGYKGQKQGNNFGFTTLDAARELKEGKYLLYRHAQPAPERDQVRREHAEWSQATFGDVGPIGPLKHLSKEALEAAEEPGDLSEWADMQFLMWDAQRRAGITDEQITQAMIEKLAVNKQRSWPEPKEGEPRLHIKEQPAPVVPDVMEPTIEAIKRILPTSNPDEYAACIGADMWNACRAAMLQELKKSAGTEAICRSDINVQVLHANPPVIPDGSASMLRRWLAFGRGMQNAGSQLPHNLIAETESMLAAAPQEVKGE